MTTVHANGPLLFLKEKNHSENKICSYFLILAAFTGSTCNSCN